MVRLRGYATWLDAGIQVPLVHWRIGIDPLLGLVPGLGDAIGAVLAGWIVLEALRRSVPAATLARMALNIAIDTALGTIPIVGDIFDFGWRSNLRNVDLLERHVRDRDLAIRADRQFVVLLAVATAGVAMALLVAGGWVLVQIAGMIVKIASGN